jgi:hypothetical protein
MTNPYEENTFESTYDTIHITQIEPPHRLQQIHKIELDKFMCL